MQLRASSYEQTGNCFSLLASCSLLLYYYLHAMMRKKLAAEDGVRKKFRAVFSRFGKKVNYQGYSETTVLLVNIVDPETNSAVADHLWFTYTKGFENARITEGSTIEFEARVKEYSKGYVNKKYGINQRKRDYKLSHPTKIAVVGS